MLQPFELQLAIAAVVGLGIIALLAIFFFFYYAVVDIGNVFLKRPLIEGVVRQCFMELAGIDFCNIEMALLMGEDMWRFNTAP